MDNTNIGQKRKIKQISKEEEDSLLETKDAALDSVKFSVDGMTETNVNENPPNSHQTSIAEYVVNRKMRCNNKAYRAEQREIASREIRGSQRDSSIRGILRHCISSYSFSPITIESSHDAVYNWNTHLEFNTSGTLLATSTSQRCIEFYNFRDYCCLEENWRNPKNKVEERRQNLRLSLIRTIFVRHEVRKIQWNPYTKSNQMACCFTTSSDILIYDVDLGTSVPSYILKTGRHPTTGNCDILFVLSDPSNSTLIAGDYAGCTRQWKIGKSTKPTWEINKQDGGAIKSLCLSLDNNYLYCGTSKGWITVWNIRNLLVPPFGSRPTPPRIAFFSLKESLLKINKSVSQSRDYEIHSMKFTPHRADLLLCKLVSGWLVILDSKNGKMQRFHALKRKRTLKVAANKTESQSMAEEQSLRDEVKEMNFIHQQQNDTGSFLLGGRIYCTAIPGEQCICLVDLILKHPLKEKPKKQLCMSISNTFQFILKGNIVQSSQGKMIEFNLPIDQYLTTNRREQKGKSNEVMIKQKIYKILDISKSGKTVKVSPSVELDQGEDGNGLAIRTNMQVGQGKLQVSQKNDFERMQRLPIPLNAYATAIAVHPIYDIIALGCYKSQLVLLAPVRESPLS